MDYKKLHKDTINRLQQMVSCGKITVEVARGICADFIPESEDEKIIIQIGDAVGDYFPTPVADKIKSWLKDLKDRVQPQPKQEWSEEDERIVTELIGIFESAVDGGHVTFPYRLVKDYIRVLKLCLPQSAWKPSDEMLEALYRVIPENVMEKSEDEILLDKLYQGLKYGRVLSKD